MDESVDISVQIKLIKKQPLFSQLTDAEADELASLFTEKKVAIGEKVVKEGDPVDSFYLIASGTAEVRISTFVDNKRETKSVATLNPGDAIGLNETGFYSLSGKRTATVIALTEMVVYRMGMAPFHGFTLAHSHVSEIMHKHTENVMNEKQ
jgi:CRP-like cAMP-binding protein